MKQGKSLGLVGIQGTAIRPDWAQIRDLFSAALLGTALSAALMPSLGHSIGLFPSFLYVSAALLFWWGISRRRWILPILLTGSGIAAFIICYLSQQDTALRNYWTGFFSWWQSGCPVQLPFSQNGALEAVRFLTVLLPAGILYLYFRKLFHPVTFLLIPAGSAVLIWWLYISEAEYLIPVTVLLSVTMLTGLARICGRSISERLGNEKTVSVPLMQLCALILATAAALLSVLAIPGKDGKWQWDGLVKLVQDVGDLYLEGNGGLSADGSFSIGASGFMPLKTRLGGDIDPINDIVIRVKTDTPSLLAGAVYNTYDGQNWYDSGALGCYRYQSIFWRGRRNDAFGAKLPLGGRKTARLFDQMTADVPYTISTGLSTSSYFVTGRLRSILPDKAIDDIYFNRQGELFTESRRDGDRYELQATILTRGTADFDEKIGLLESALEGTRDPQWEEIAAVYTALPENLPVSVREIAWEITEGIDSPYLQAAALESWLRENCSYTLTPGEPEEGRDFVEQFLEKREGYCVYYATAMTVMARTLGLPARYVTGYGLKENPDERSYYAYVATNATAHAWCEVYLSGIGWVPFDPTGWNPDEPAAEDEPEPEVIPEITESPQTPPIPEQPPEIPEIQPEIPETPVSFPWERVWTFLGIGLLVLLILWIRMKIQRQKIDQKYRRLMRRYPDYTQRIDACWKDILTQLRFLGFSPAPDDTLSRFAEKVAPMIPGFDAVAVRMIQIRFAAQPPQDEDLQALCSFSRRLEGQLRQELGKWKYIWRRMIIGR